MAFMLESDDPQFLLKCAVAHCFVFTRGEDESEGQFNARHVTNMVGFVLKLSTDQLQVICEWLESLSKSDAGGASIFGEVISQFFISDESIPVNQKCRMETAIGFAIEKFQCQEEKKFATALMDGTIDIIASVPLRRATMVLTRPIIVTIITIMRVNIRRITGPSRSVDPSAPCPSDAEASFASGAPDKGEDGYFDANDVFIVS